MNLSKALDIVLVALIALVLILILGVGFYLTFLSHPSCGDEAGVMLICENN
jgi:hypothetical protein